MILRPNLPPLRELAGAAERVLDVGGWCQPFNLATYVVDLRRERLARLTGRQLPMEKVFSPAEWRAYYSEKRVLHQWTQLDLLAGTGARRVLEIGPAYGLVTAMLANAGYEVTTLDRVGPGFASPRVPHIEGDITALFAADIAGYDAILCCETLEHIDWGAVPTVLAALRDSGAGYLVISVPYHAFQITFDLYLNAWALRHYFSMKKLLSRREFVREPPGGHQWEIGYKGFPLKRWEACLSECGWRIVRRAFTGHTRSVFHLLEAR